ncbi:MAG TPA: hypothetical protein PLB81_13255, partial [Deltaproteobacteria bacterium]|nr:hypothetical protein [Deltaproteobacteria bacterium]
LLAQAAVFKREKLGDALKARRRSPYIHGTRVEARLVSPPAFGNKTAAEPFKAVHPGPHGRAPCAAGTG